MRLRSLLIVAFVAMASVFMAGRASADELVLHINEAMPVRLSGAAEGIAVGNPSVAGVSVQDERMIFITGRAYGTTNIVVVGAGGRLLFSSRVVVGADESAGAVMVTRGLSTQRLSCTPLCRPDPDIGDDPNLYSQATSQIQSLAARGGD